MGLGLYIHIPFCQKKCHFCSFAVTVSQISRGKEYLSALEREAQKYAGTSVGSVYVGGGTPSCLDVDQIEVLWRLVSGAFVVEPRAERTFEVNPESWDRDKAQALLNAQCARLSVGVQSLNDRTLEFLGRVHRRGDALRAFALAREMGFRNINVDLMYGFPGQTAADLAADLDGIVSLESEHVSIYSLAVEERSLFFAKGLGVNNEAQADAYEFVRQRLEGAGLRQYEISNFARPGFESQHNLNYWRGGEYIGLGMASHSHLAGERSWNADTLSTYLSLIREQGSAIVGRERLEPAAKLLETFLFALRMNEGVDLDELERKIGVELPSDKKEALESFMEMGLLEEHGERLQATTRGRLVLDEISARLI